MSTLDPRFALSLLERRARIGAWRIDLPSRRLHWSRGVYEIYGLTDQAAPSLEDGLAYYESGDRQRIVDAVERCATQGVPFDLEVRFRPRGRPALWARAIGEAVRDVDGTIVAVQGALQDITEGREAVTEVARRRERFVELADALPVLVWAADPSGRVGYANALLDRYAGPAGVAELGRAPSTGRLVHPDDAGRFAACWAQALDTRESAGCEARLRRDGDGAWRWHACSVSPVRDVAGGLVRWFGVGIDVHEGVSAAREAVALAQRLRNTLEAITDGFMIIDRRWRFALLNGKAEQLLHRSRDELLGRNVWQEFPAAVGSDFERAYRRARSTGQTVVFEAYYPAPLDAWFSVRAYPSGEGLAVYFQDVTAQREAEQRLSDSEARYRAIATAVSDGVWDWDLTDDRITWNEGLRRHFGHDPADVPTGEAWIALVHPDDRERVTTLIDEVIQRGKPKWTGRYRFLRADGSEATVEDEGTVLRDETGAAVRFVGAFRDVSDEVEAEERLRRSQRMEALGHLVGGVAHDFNNLLTVIHGNSEILEEELRGTANEELAALSRQASERGADLTHRLLAFARKQPLAPRPICVRELVESMSPLLRRALREDIHLNSCFEEGLPAAFADPSQLEGTLLNLSLNARDAMPSGGKLCIEGRTAIFDDDYAEAHPEVSPGRYVMVAVADTGCGIPRENLSHVFEPFFTTKPPGTGTGLGLSMAYGFARQSGGHLQIYSEVDRGTTVKLYLPIASPGADVHQRPGDAVPEPRRWPDTRSVLVVEDDDLVRQNVVRQLTRLGYEVTAVRDATEALGMLRSGASVDLLFSDVVLTGAMSGAELGREVRREFPAVPILFTSGYSDALIADQGHLDEDVSLLPKPYTRAELARAVERVLSTSGR